MSGPTLAPLDVDQILAGALADAALGPSGTEVTWATLDGDRVVVKSATGRARAVLRREAEVLQRIDSVGLVRVRDVHEVDGVTAMVLDDAGHQTLARPVDLSPDVVLRALQHTCQVVAALHRAGWTHGSLVPEHVVVGPRGRVRLCSLGAARPLSDRPDGGRADVLALRDLVCEQLPDERRATRRLRERLRGTDPPDADAIAEAVRSLRQGGPRRSPRWLTPSARLAAVGAVGTVLTGAAAVGLFPETTESTESTTRDSATGAMSVESTAPGSTATSAPAPVPASAPAPTVVVDGVTYRVGRPGDVAVLGRWDCGPARVRSLRPATGELFEFAGFPGGTDATEGVLVDVVGEAVAMRVERATCDRTIVIRNGGDEVVIP